MCLVLVDVRFSLWTQQAERAGNNSRCCVFRFFFFIDFCLLSRWESTTIEFVRGFCTAAAAVVAAPVVAAAAANAAASL